MAGWLAVLETAQKYLDAGQPEKASAAYRAGLNVYQDDQAATGWLTFNLMLSETTQHGFETARAYLVPIIESNISWNAKLYTLEMALSSATPESDNLTGLYADSLASLQRYIISDAGPDDINIMSCQTITRHIYRLFGSFPLDPCFLTKEDEDSLPVIYKIEAHSDRPGLPVMYNRLPAIVERSYHHYKPEIRPLGFRHIGPGFLLRLGNNTVVFDAEGLPLETPYGPLPAFLCILLQKSFTSAKMAQRIVPGTSLFIGDYFSQALNYCHWLLDGMPRIIAGRAAGLHFDRIIGAFAETAAFQTQSLKRLLHPSQTYVSMEAKEGLVAFENLYYADNASLLHIHHPLYNGDTTLLPELRSQLSQGILPSGVRRRLYVPRKHNRVVLNEAVLMEILKSYKFECIDTDSLSFEEQVAIFAGAEAVVGPHGAALSNLLFSPPGCRVLEFFPPFGGSASFYRLAASCGHCYACYIDDTSQGPNRDETDGIINNTVGISVDLQFVADWLAQNFAPPPSMQS